jgi:XTP/dITP diphosphohydrolase
MLQSIQTLLVATFNPGKVKEIEEFLSSFSIRVIGLNTLSSLKPCSEVGKSFKENACQKAQYYSRFSSALTLADDSGLVVDALDGQPGIHSARFVSQSATDEERYREVLFRMREVPEDKRSARFVCCIALACQGKLLDVCEGYIEGIIAREPRGTYGFGYDPIFLLPKLGKTMAQLEPAEKLKISHRGRALEKVAAVLTLQDRVSRSQY